MKARLITDNWAVSQDFDGYEILDIHKSANVSCREYHYYGLRHRTDGPAIEWAHGTNEWFLNGIRHRIDGPAIEYVNGDRAWYKNGELHREDGPAIELGGINEWWVNGQRHREDGPAVEKISKAINICGTNEWWINGKCQKIENFHYDFNGLSISDKIDN